MPDVAFDTDGLARVYLDGSGEARDLLQQCLSTLAVYHEGHSSIPRGAARRRYLQRRATALRQLHETLSELMALDPRSMALAMIDDGRAASSVEQDGVQGEVSPRAFRPSRLDGLQAFHVLMELLLRAEDGLLLQADQEPVRRVGREGMSDVLVFGVDCLDSLWRQHRAHPPTQSAKSGGFGAFAQDVLTAAPFSFSAAAVRHIVARALPQSSQIPAGPRRSGPPVM
jgi:hypothetical protein